MSRKAIPIAFLIALSSLVLVAAGCGSSKKSSSNTTPTQGAATTEAASTEATTTEATTTEATSTDSGGTGASAKECQDFATAASSVGQQFSSALSGAGGADIGKASQAFDELTAKAPADIRDDFQTIDDAFKKMAVALKGVDLSGGKVPDAATLAKLQQLGTQIDQAKLAQASKNISTWASTNCSKG